MTKTEQMASRRRANQREVVRKRNQASARRRHEDMVVIKLSTGRCRHRRRAQRLTRVQVLVGVKGFLEPLLSPEGSDGPQSLKRRRQVGEDGTASCEKGGSEDKTSYLLNHYL